jgi:hypothetical protein
MIKYVDAAGVGRVWNGPLAELQRRDFFSRSFGPLERPLERDERINSTDGSIEKIPLTVEQQTEIDEKTQAKTTLDALKGLTFVQFQALTQAQKILVTSGGGTLRANGGAGGQEGSGDAFGGGGGGGGVVIVAAHKIEDPGALLAVASIGGSAGTNGAGSAPTAGSEGVTYIITPQEL